jgi:hypothetical protein
MPKINDINTYPVSTDITGNELFIASSESGGVTINLNLNDILTFINNHPNLGSWNIKLVSTEADFGTALGGAITLAENTMYFLTTNITTTNRFIIPNLGKVGLGSFNNIGEPLYQLIYNGTGTLITGNSTNNLTIYNLILKCLNGTLFDINGDGETQEIHFINVVFLSNTIGDFKNLNKLKFKELIFKSYVNGFTFENNNFINVQDVQIDNTIATESSILFNFPNVNSNTIEKALFADFCVKQLNNGAIFYLATELVINININIRNGCFDDNKNTLFFKENSLDQNNEKITVKGITSVQSSLTKILITVQNNNVESFFLSKNSETPINIDEGEITTNYYPLRNITAEVHTYIDGEPGNVDHPKGVNAITGMKTLRITYTGKITNFTLGGSISFSVIKLSGGSSTKQSYLRFHINGYEVLGIKQTCEASSDGSSTTMPILITLQPNDYFEIWAGSPETLDNICFFDGVLALFEVG